MSTSIDNDNLFKIFMNGVWNMDLVEVTNGAGVTKPAGNVPEVYGKTAREQWKYENHKSLFGDRDETPMKHEVNQVYTKKHP